MVFVLDRDCRCCMDFVRIPEEVLKKLIEDDRELDAIEHCDYCLSKYHGCLHPIIRDGLRSVKNVNSVQPQP